MLWWLLFKTHLASFLNEPPLKTMYNAICRAGPSQDLLANGVACQRLPRFTGDVPALVSPALSCTDLLSSTHLLFPFFLFNPEGEREGAGYAEVSNQAEVGGAPWQSAP